MTLWVDPLFIALLNFRLELVRRPSYASRYRTVRDRYPGDTSPQRRTATIVRRVPDTAVVEGKNIFSMNDYS